MIAAKYGNTNQLHVAQNYVFRFADRLPSIVVNELVHAGEMGGRSPDEILTALLHHLKVFHRSSSETQEVFAFRPKSRRRQLPPGLTQLNVALPIILLIQLFRQMIYTSITLKRSRVNEHADRFRANIIGLGLLRRTVIQSSC